MATRSCISCHHVYAAGVLSTYNDEGGKNLDLALTIVLS